VWLLAGLMIIATGWGAAAHRQMHHAHGHGEHEAAASVNPVDESSQTPKPQPAPDEGQDCELCHLLRSPGAVPGPTLAVAITTPTATERVPFDADRVIQASPLCVTAPRGPPRA
jgi:hypothetical protein